jgi:ribosomal protein L37AE/L43A
MLYHFDNLPMNSSDQDWCTVLIKDTSGLLVIAKRKLRCHICNLKPNIRRKYGIAKCSSCESGTIEGNVAHVKDRMQMAVLLILR